MMLLARTLKAFATPAALLLLAGLLTRTTLGEVKIAPPGQDRTARFHFPSDAFAFTNQLSSDYELDPVRGRMIEHPRAPRPPYTLHCFVLVRAARQFQQHGRFDPAEPKASEAQYRYLVRRIIARSARSASAERRKLVLPGYANLREFSREHEALLKTECGGAWLSFAQRGNWRIVFPFTRAHQQRTAERLVRSVTRGRLPLVHLVCFPEMNHGLLLFAADAAEDAICFSAYDPNQLDAIQLWYSRGDRTFYCGRTPYFAGGRINVYEIFHGLCY